MSRVTAWAVVVVGVGSLAASTGAFASGFAVRENCTEGVGTAFAGAGSLADDPCTVFNNPAGMTRLKGTQAEIGSSIVFPTVNFHGTDTAGGNSGNNGGRSVLIPDLYAVTDILPALKGGVAVTSPFGLPIKYNSAWAGRYLTVQSKALSVDINPNLAYKINDQYSIAAGVSAQYFNFTLSKAINQTGLLGFTAPDALARFKGDDWSVGYNFGFLGEPLPGTRIGVTYRSKVEHKLAGDQDFLNVSPFLSGLLASSAATADISLPATTGLSVTHEFSPQWSIASDVQYSQWSTFRAVGFVALPATTSSVNVSYRDSWFTSLGVIYHPDDTWTFRGGFAWDQSPVRNLYRTVAVPDQDRYMVGLGFGYKLNDLVSFDAAYAHYFATHASMNGSINNTDTLTLTQLSGTYQLSLDYISFAVRLSF